MASDANTTLVAILARMDGIFALLSQIAEHQAKATAPAAAAPVRHDEVASDDDLDGPYGDVVVKFPPKDWDGPDYTGQPLSKTDAKFCRRMAGFWSWQAEKDEAGTDEKKAANAKYKRKDAARARGWAKRHESGTVKGDDIPF